MPLTYAPAGTPAYAAQNLWGVAGGPNALVPFAEQAAIGYPTGLPTFAPNYRGGVSAPTSQGSPAFTPRSVMGGAGGAGGYSPSNTSAQDQTSGRDSNAQNTSGGLIGGPSAASGGSGPSTSGLGTNSFGSVFIGAAPRSAEVARVEESQRTYRVLAYAAAGMSALGFAFLMMKR